MKRLVRSLSGMLLVALLGTGLWWLVFFGFAGSLWSGAAAIDALSIEQSPPGQALGERVFAELRGMLWQATKPPRPPAPEQATGGELWERLLWQALTGKRSEQQGLIEQALAAHPRGRALRAFHFVWLLDQLVAAPQTSTNARLRGLEAAAQAGLAVDSDNGVYPLGLCIARLAVAWEQTPNALPEAAQREALDSLFEAAEQPRLRFYHTRTNRLSLARRVGVPLESWQGVFALNQAHDLQYHWPLYDALGSLSEHAAALHSVGQRADAQGIWQAIVDVSLRYQQGSELLIDLLTGVAVETEARRRRAEAWVEAGEASAAARELKIVAAIEELLSEVQTLPQNTALPGFGALDNQLVPAGGGPGDSAWGRQLEYRTFGLLALGALALCLVLWAALNTGGALWNGQDRLIWPKARMLWLMQVFGVLAPVAAWLFFDNFHPSRQIGLFYQPAVLIQPLALSLLVPALLLWLARRLEDSGDLPEPPDGRRRAALFLLGLGCFLACFWTGNVRAILALHSPASWALLCWFVAGLVMLDAGLVARRSLSVELRAQRQLRVAVASLLGVLLVLAVSLGVGLPVYQRAEQDYLQRVVLPLSQGEVSITRWSVVRDFDRESTPP